MSKTVIGISGSLRKESYSKKLLQAFAQQVPEGYELKMLDISGLPMFNEDLEADEPTAVTDFKQAISSAQAVLLIAPEYNRSYTPAIKNALDWGSRPVVATGERVWIKKPVAIAGCSPYAFGAFGAVHHLRQVLVYIDMIPMQQPEFYLSNVADKFNEHGTMIDETTHERIDSFWEAFAKHIEKLT